MNDNLEAFVQKLYDEGVQTGQDKANELVRTAKQQAEEIIKSAEKEATRLKDEALQASKQQNELLHTELKLAARDLILNLKAQISNGLTRVLMNEVDKTLSNGEFITKLVFDLVTEYIHSDIKANNGLRINVNKTNFDQLTAYITERLKSDPEGSMPIFESTMKKAGFEYRLDESVVEVSDETITALLEEYISEKVNSLIDEAMKQK